MNEEEKEISKMKEEDVKPNIKTYNKVMNANSDNVERVEELWKEMQENGIQPNVVSYNTRLQADTDDLERVELIWKKMKENGIKSDGTTYSTMIPVHYKAGNMDRVKELETEARAAGFAMYQ